ncbi:MAG: 5-methyltetrahydropteroyltriglutamate--homocysteine methyltransferase [Xanthomonadales bacterium]|nr:5-methyltetrahydropteroyltriglutamate--homocysteine methyltransferase [Xanthomonadales bacterium]NIN58342.1 5-methyltetrahydropteroyltriglutamate--homocysteine methyltransferase [Xanthomonadales bacterium]NIN73681.1 5-methyltetrahydropteroyltriglutamate--homocysteine methyltransferase [Xanthomonadales bacterium]NIO14472.1 5-methyltetrahydropteroyltriglutamate--homocysteine methyltransferase [Xanthomonadales bacterium]NIP10735.1 5-methyltetrahydropteroyltriglutamate--homocysteine methyltransf
MSASLPLFPCTIVGSYPQPDWLIDRDKLSKQFPPRTRALELWRITEPWLEEAQNDATRIAIQDQERAGLDIVTDGEIRRESYSNHFATALDGIDLDNPGQAKDRSGETVYVPRIVGPIRRRHPVGIEDVRFLRANTDRAIKMTVPGPFTMAQQAQNDHYASEREAALDYAAAVNEEIMDLFAAGADYVQLDEPYMQARPEKANEYGIEALNRALEGVAGKTCVHICFGYAALIHERPAGYSFLPQLCHAHCNQVSIETAQSNLDCTVLESLPGKQILLGVLDLSTEQVESAETIKSRVRKALEHVDPEQILLASDCGMKYLSRQAAFGKMASMVQAARELREEYAGS